MLMTMLMPTPPCPPFPFQDTCDVGGDMYDGMQTAIKRGSINTEKQYPYGYGDCCDPQDPSQECCPIMGCEPKAEPVVMPLRPACAFFGTGFGL